MEKAKQEILYWSKRLYDKGFSPSTSGNISVKVGDKILISKSGVCLNDMSFDDIVLIDLEGNVLEQGKKASSERFLHVAIYEKREDIKAIIHSHEPYISAYAVARKEIKAPILPDFIYYFDKVPLAPYFTPSSIELAQETSKYFNKYSCVLMENHGVILGTDSLQNCFYNLEMLKNYVQICFGAEMLGGAKPLNKKQIEEVKNLKR